DPSTLSATSLKNAAESALLSYLGSIANVTVQGNITASGNIAISAQATNMLGLSLSAGNDLLMLRLTEATAQVGGNGTTPTLTAGGTASVGTQNTGDRGSHTQNETVVIDIGIDRSEATIDGATINAAGLMLNAQSAANYAMTGSKVLNLIDGDTTADVVDGAHVNVTTGGALISSSE